MKQREDTKTRDFLASANARRQAEFKRRWMDAGWRRSSLWINEKDFAAGKKAGRSAPLLALMGGEGRSVRVHVPWPDGADPRSWMLGFVEGLAGNLSVAGRVSLSHVEGAAVPAPTTEPVVGRKASRARSGGGAGVGAKAREG